ncbi:MAG: InlB B-repeat-containing protein [Anaeroplasmataceae bacterium]
MKKLLLLILIFLMFLSGCKLDEKWINFQDDYFYYKAIDDTNCAVGNIISLSNEDEYFYIPYFAREYKVTRLGFSSGLGFGGNGFFSATSYGHDISLYCPSSITSFSNNYLQNASVVSKLFYCGEVLDLSLLSLQNKTMVYVPSNEYDEFIQINTSYESQIKKANVIYNYNYNEKYYYIDYYQNDSSIQHMPPTPNRENYIFTGWYKDSKCTSLWDFENDKINMGGDSEIVLYAGWNEV